MFAPRMIRIPSASPELKVVPMKIRSSMNVNTIVRYVSIESLPAFSYLKALVLSTIPIPPASETKIKIKISNPENKLKASIEEPDSGRQRPYTTVEVRER